MLVIHLNADRTWRAGLYFGWEVAAPDCPIFQKSGGRRANGTETRCVCHVVLLGNDDLGHRMISSGGILHHFIMWIGACHHGPPRQHF